MDREQLRTALEHLSSNVRGFVDNLRRRARRRFNGDDGSWDPDFRRGERAYRSDFLGKSHLVHGRWARESTKLSEDDKIIRRFFGGIRIQSEQAEAEQKKV